MPVVPVAFAAAFFVAHTAPQSLPVAEDCTLLQLSPDTNVGSNPNVRAMEIPGDVRESVLKFDLSAISGVSGTQVQSAVLRLWVTIVDAGGQVTVASASTPWMEGTVTWNSKPAMGPQVSIATVLPTHVGDFIDLDVTSIVRTWANGGPNHGLYLASSAGSGLNARFASRENTASSPPTILVTQVPGPAGGHAYIPGWRSGDPSGVFALSTDLFLSNISDVQVDVTVELYTDGLLVADNGDPNSGVIYASGFVAGSYSDAGPTTFSIAPISTVRLLIEFGRPGPYKFGWGRVSYLMSQGGGPAMLAWGYSREDQSGSGTKNAHASISVNGGLPF
jgi:hypothetical protein